MEPFLSFLSVVFFNAISPRSSRSLINLTNIYFHQHHGEQTRTEFRSFGLNLGEMSLVTLHRRLTPSRLRLLLSAEAKLPPPTSSSFDVSGARWAVPSCTWKSTQRKATTGIMNNRCNLWLNGDFFFFFASPLCTSGRRVPTCDFAGRRRRRKNKTKQNKTKKRHSCSVETLFLCEES